MAAKEATKGHWDREQEQPKGNNNPRCDDHQKQEEGKNKEVTMNHPLDESSDGSKEGGGVWESECVCVRQSEWECLTMRVRELLLPKRETSEKSTNIKCVSAKSKKQKKIKTNTIFKTCYI